MRFPTTVAGLDSKINARFLLNEHGGLYFLFFVHVILLNLEKEIEKLIRRKKDIAGNVHKTVQYSRLQIMTTKTTT